MHPKYDMKKLDGKIYVLDGRLGYATYYFHFGAPYTDYSNYPGSLADGSKIPEKKPFENWTWDPATRKFTADVNWSSPFSGYDKWKYECVFSEDFKKINGGGITYMSTTGPDTSFCPFGPDGFDF